MNKKLFVIVVAIIILFLLTTSFLYLKRIQNFMVHRGLQKNQDILADKFVESAPFVWNNELKYIIFQRDEENKKYDLAIYDFKTKEKISGYGEGLGLGSVLVQNDRLYIFATKNWMAKSDSSNRSEVVMITTDDLKNFSEPATIYTAADRQILFNSSVTYNPDQKKYIMALETDEPGFVAFSIRFLESDDLSHWNLFPDRVFGRYAYAACPTIRYIDGYYYLWYLKAVQFDPNQPTKNSYVEQLSKSGDLIDWQTSPQYVLAPDQKGEGIDTSDIDFIEYKNKMYILYAIGDQVTWAKIKYAVFDGGLDTWVKQFYFPDSKSD